MSESKKPVKVAPKRVNKSKKEEKPVETKPDFGSMYGGVASQQGEEK